MLKKFGENPVVQVEEEVKEPVVEQKHLAVV